MNSTHLDGREVFVREDRGSKNTSDGAAAGGSVAVLLQAVACSLASGLSFGGGGGGGGDGDGETKKLKSRSRSLSPPPTNVARAVHLKPTNSKQGHR
jgi:hypothetical protein